MGTVSPFCVPAHGFLWLYNDNGKVETPSDILKLSASLCLQISAEWLSMGPVHSFSRASTGMRHLPLKDLAAAVWIVREQANLKL
jgi:hypothetical protein